MNRFKNKIVLITGGANGLGRGMAEQYLKEGAKVAIFDIEDDTMESVFGNTPNVLCIHCDVRNYDAVQAAVRQVLDYYGHIDILMNNAGIVHRQSFRACTKDAWEDTINTNLNGVFFVGQAVANSMIEKGIQGVIVNTSSISARKTGIDTSSYGPSKAAVTNLTMVMALELAQFGIRVNAIGPGTTKTRIINGTVNNPVRNALFLSKSPFGRYGEVREAVDLALFLASDEASFITGETLFEDGGFCLT